MFKFGTCGVHLRIFVVNSCEDTTLQNLQAASELWSEPRPPSRVGRRPDPLRLLLPRCPRGWPRRCPLGCLGHQSWAGPLPLQVILPHPLTAPGQGQAQEAGRF